MDHAANKEKYSSINRIAIAERASLEEVDRPFLYPISATRGRWWRQRNRKTYFCYLMLKWTQVKCGHPMTVTIGMRANMSSVQWQPWESCLGEQNGHTTVLVLAWQPCFQFFFKRYTMNCFQLYVYWINFEERTRIFGLVLFFLTEIRRVKS